jgi:hypothetical protein
MCAAHALTLVHAPVMFCSLIKTLFMRFTVPVGFNVVFKIKK